MGLKEFFQKLKEENKNMAKTTKRINGSGFYGNVNRQIKDGDFWQGSYVSIESKSGVIYSTKEDDYIFNKEDIVSFTLADYPKTKVTVGNIDYKAVRYIIAFKDGKRAYVDIIADRVDSFMSNFQL